MHTCLQNPQVFHTEPYLTNGIEHILHTLTVDYGLSQLNSEISDTERKHPVDKLIVAK